MLLFDDVQRPHLAIPAAVKEKSWLDSVALSRFEHRWNHYLNQLALAAVMPWIESYYSESVAAHGESSHQADGQANSQAQAHSQVWPSPTAAIQRWQWVNGTAVSIGDRRLVIVPTDSLETQEFRVQQEWVDIPTWCGDYYLMVQVNPDAERVQLRGYLSHRQLKQGHYDEGDRTYCIETDALVHDLDLLWVMAALESETERRAAIAPLPALSLHQATPWIAQLCEQFPAQEQVQGQTQVQAEHQSPKARAQPALRLALPFPQWGGILNNPQLVRQLNRRAAERLGATANLSAELSQWFQGNFEAAWRSREQLLVPQLAWGVRTLTAQSISRGKQVALETLDSDLMLWTTVTAEIDGRMRVLVQLRPSTQTEGELNRITDESDALTAQSVSVRSSQTQSSSAQQLPQGVQLILVTPAEEALQVVTAQEKDDYIQLKRFKVLAGQVFSVEVRLGEQTIREQFRA